MCRSGVRNTSHNIRLYMIPSGKQLTTTVAHLFYTDSLIGRRRITIVDPEESTDFHIFARCNQCYLVNLKYVKAVENDFVHVNTDHLEISRRQRAAFLTAVASYIGGVL